MAMAKQHGLHIKQREYGALPPVLHTLFITSPQKTGSWLAEAFASDSASNIILKEAQGITAGVERLRNEPFDAVLVAHEEGELDALLLVDAIRTSAHSQQPIVVMGAEPESEMGALCYESGADAYVCLENVTTRMLIWLMARAVERHQLEEENRRFHQEKKKQMQREKNETDHLLDQQRALGDSPQQPPQLPEPREPSFSSVPPSLARLPEGMLQQYRALIRAHVIMGTGNLGSEIYALGRQLSKAGIATHTAMALHVYVVEELVQSLGQRSARHVMNRADLFILEVILHMAEGYRQVATKKEKQAS